MLCFGMTWSTSLREAPTAPAEELPAELRTEHPVPFDEDTILSEHLQEAAYLMDVPNSAVTPESPISEPDVG